MHLIVSIMFMCDKHEIQFSSNIIHSVSNLIHWGRVTQICVFNQAIIAPDNGLSPSRHQAIIWTNAGMLLIGPLGLNLSEILIEMHTFSFKKMHSKKSFAKCRPLCLGLNVLNLSVISFHDFFLVELTFFVMNTYLTRYCQNAILLAS